MGKNCAVIVAAGKGTRMGAAVNKQFIHINEKAVLYYTLKAFTECMVIDEIVLVLSSADIEYCKDNVINEICTQKPIVLIEGGTTRQESVFNGLKSLKDCDIVLIHDGARPFITSKIIEDGVKYAEIYGACACGVRPKDTIKVINSQGFSASTPDRASLFSVQTPQCFKYELILECHRRIQIEAVAVTDDTMIVERYGYKVFLYDGDYNNIKITTKEDLAIGESILYSRK